MTLIRFWRETTILILAGILGFCYLIWPQPSPPEIREVVKNVVKERVVTKTVVKTVTKLPDGTIIEKHEEIAKVSDTKSDKKESVVAAAVKASRYQVFVLSPIRAPAQVEIGVGAQLGTLPVEAITSYDLESKAIKLGIGVRF